MLVDCILVVFICGTGCTNGEFAQQKNAFLLMTRKTGDITMMVMVMAMAMVLVLVLVITVMTMVM